MDLDRRGAGEDLGRVGEGEIVIKLYSKKKKYIFNTRKIETRVLTKIIYFGDGTC